MKRTKKLLAILLAVSFTLAMLAGCGTAGSSPTVASSAAPSSSSAEATGTAAAAAPKDHFDISIALWDIDKAFPEGKQDKVADALCSKLNITIKPVNITWDDYTQKIQVWAASQQLPDIFAIDARKTQSYSTWVSQGVVRAVPDDLSSYPNLKSLLDIPSVQAYKDASGKYYCIPRPAYKSTANYSIEEGIKVRKDWMDAVGITQQPQNTDDFIALLKAFITKDPGKNGANNIVGITGWDRNWFVTNIAVSLMPELDTLWIKEDGKWIPGEFSKNIIAGLKDLKKIWDSGVIDKDMAVLKGTEGEDKFFTGKAGMLAHNCYLTPQEDEKWRKTYPDKKYSDCVEIIHPWKAADGKTYRFESDSIWSESYFPVAVDDKKMDRILSMYDYMLSPEGMNLYHFGIEGTDYTKSGDKVTVTRPKDKFGAFVKMPTLYPVTDTFWYLATWDTEYQYLDDPTLDPAEVKVAKDAYDFNLNKCVAMPTDLRISFLDIADKDKIVAVAADDIMVALMSSDVEKAWNDIIQGHMQNGYTQVIQEINDAAQKAGIN